MTGAVPDHVRIELLGGFRVVVGGRDIAEPEWPSRRARELVALLALADGHRMARDRVIERLWPHLEPGAGAANLRKAAHHARRSLGDPDAVVLGAGRVELFPGRAVSIDMTNFLRAAERALGDGDRDACARAADAYVGELLPDAPYEAWAQEPRRLVHARLCLLLRRSGQWDRLAAIDPTDEPACRELMRAGIDAGRRTWRSAAASACGSRWRASSGRNPTRRRGHRTMPPPGRCGQAKRCSPAASPSLRSPRHTCAPSRWIGRRRCSSVGRRASGNRRSGRKSRLARAPTAGAWC